MADVEYRGPTPSEADGLLQQVINHAEPVKDAPDVAGRAGMVQRLGYSSVQELATVLGLAPSTITGYLEGKHHADDILGQVLRKADALSRKMAARR
jgi:hypothetical protein